MTSQIDPHRLTIPPTRAGVTIAEVARRLGIPMPTLRSWELRYGIPATDRPPGQHRRYAPNELHALRLMHNEIVRGTPARVAAQNVKALLEPAPAAAALIDQFLAGTDPMSPHVIEAALEEAVDIFGVGPSIDEVLIPALRRAGSWWAVGAYDAEQEAPAVTITRAWLARRTAYLAAAPESPTALIISGPRDADSIVGAEALAMVLRTAGWHHRLLTGRGLVAQAHRIIDDRLNSDAVVIMSNLTTERRRATTSINLLRDAGYETYYAGTAFASAAARRSIPGTYLGHRIQDAARTITSEVGTATAG